MFTCITCKEEYPLTAEYFHHDKTRKSGFHPCCKPCRNNPRRTGRKTPEQRFWPKIKTLDNGCWKWTSTIDRGGYGRFCVNPANRSAMAHRYSYELHYGKIPDGYDCMHICDNPSCVNPEHLTIGTHSDNMRDMVEKGRVNTKLTGEEVVEIRALYSSGNYTHKHIADIFNVDQSNISRIINREYWKHI